MNFFITTRGNAIVTPLATTTRKPAGFGKIAGGGGGGRSAKGGGGGPRGNVSGGCRSCVNRVGDCDTCAKDIGDCTAAECKELRGHTFKGYLSGAPDGCVGMVGPDGPICVPPGTTPPTPISATACPSGYGKAQGPFGPICVPNLPPGTMEAYDKPCAFFETRSGLVCKPDVMKLGIAAGAAILLAVMVAR